LSKKSNNTVGCFVCVLCSLHALHMAPLRLINLTSHNCAVTSSQRSLSTRRQNHTGSWCDSNSTHGL